MLFPSLSSASIKINGVFFAIISAVLISFNCLFAELPVTFDLAVDPTGVSLQFDVSSDQSIEAIGAPSFTGASDHRVESATLASGAHRFIIFSLTGTSISPSGEVRIIFKPSIAMEDGAISIENITASDNSGEEVTALPNAHPVLTQSAKEYQSFEAGSALQFPKLAVDLDGAIQSLMLKVNDQETDLSIIDPFQLNWGPVNSGTYTLSLIATDNQSHVSTFDLGTYRAFNDSDVVDFPSFVQIHYGVGASAEQTAFNADPFGIGSVNGFTYLLGMNPHSPELERLPSIRLVESDEGPELVIQFIRRSNVSGIEWSLQSSNDLIAFNEISPAGLTQIDLENGTHAVEHRSLVDSNSLLRQFVNIVVVETP